MAMIALQFRKRLPLVSMAARIIACCRSCLASTKGARGGSFGPAKRTHRGPTVVPGREHAKRDLNPTMWGKPTSNYSESGQGGG